VGLSDRLRQKREAWRQSYEESQARREWESLDPAAQVEFRLRAAHERVAGLERSPYSELVDTHLAEALHQYTLASIKYHGALDLLGLTFGGRDLKRNEAANRAGEDALRAWTWLITLVARVAEAATHVSEAEMDRFTTKQHAEWPEGNYALELAATEGDPNTPFAGGHEFVVGKAITFGFTPNAAEELALKIENVGPQDLISNVSLETAILVKQGLEHVGLSGRIKEGRSVSSSGRRDPIPESVRHEVWRRDGGQCVDCGSRDRLEFDHIIPLSKGGSNTARNIELRCQDCNRKKGASI
jgi:hypothetical protein